MCGIAGLWVSDHDNVDVLRRSLDRMLASIAHRGPDDCGVWSDAEAGVVLGHRRLAVIDPSPLGHQPMVSDDGHLVVVFNGEIYNFPELRHELISRGARFKSNSDTEVLLHGYRQWGESLVERLVGMYAFAIWNGRERCLYLARDRAGEKPLYHASGRWGFAFASELGALAELPGVCGEIDRDALSLYLQFQYVPAPHSIYRTVRKLPPAHAMRVRNGMPDAMWRYWDPVPFAVGPRLTLSVDDATEELESLLRHAVRGQMIADVPLGAFLSGGIDSTAVVSLMTELSSVPVRTFTVGFDVPQFDESKHAAAVANHLGTDHTLEYLTEQDALALVGQVPTMYGEPFADSSALPTHLVARMARRAVTVSLSGDGGDEAFGGYHRYTTLAQLGRAFRLLDLSGPLRDLVTSALSRFPGRLGRGGALLRLPQREVSHRMIRVFSATDARALGGRLPLLSELERAWELSAELPLQQRAMLADLLTYLPEAILVKVDRAAMATSLETRAPLLDHRVLEFALQLPAHLLRGKCLLKRLVYRRVPQEIMDRQKQGFGVPLSRWFRGELRPLLYDTLTASRMQDAGIQDFSIVQRTMDEHMSGTCDRELELWALLVLGMWTDARRRREVPAPARWSVQLV